MSLQFFSGKSPKYSNIPNGNVVIGQAANTGDKIDLNLAKYCTNEFKQDMPKFYYLKNGDILLNTLGNGTLGRTGIFNLEMQDILTDGHLFIFRMLFLITSYYLYYYLKNNRTMIEKSANGTTNQVFLNSSMVGSYLIPLPPLAEQERIINKINLFQPLLEQYDKLEKQLTKLENEITGKLKKSILQYAIQGKLVKQDPNDEPASVLLERIKAEKEKLIKEGKIKRDKNESFIYQGDDKNYYENINGKVVNITDEIPFDIPDNWCWTKIKNISNSYIGLTYKPSDISEKGKYLVLRSSNIKNGKLDLNDNVRVNASINDKLLVHKNDIIICARNGSKKLVGKSALIDIDLNNTTFGAFMAICKTPIYNYVYLFLQSQMFYKQLNKTSGTTTINQLTQNAFNEFILPIPTIKEQMNIHNKIELLFNYIK